MAFRWEGAELSEVIPPLFVLETVSRRGWQPNKLPQNFLRGEEGRGGALDSSFAGSHPLRATASCLPEVTPGSGRAQKTGDAHQLVQHTERRQEQKPSPKRKGTEECTQANVATSETP